MNSSFFILIFLHLSFLLFILHFGVSREIVCIPSERETLLKLKLNLTDPSNRLSSWNPTSNSNCCDWYGVVCSNVTSHILQLHLNTSPPPVYDYYIVYDYEIDREAYKTYKRTQFGGEINPCLVDLKHLNYLDLSDNDFGGMPIPSFLGTMTSLTHLNLSYAGFMGKIPHQIGNLSNLLYLGLSNAANGTIPSQIGNLSNLVYLELGGYYNEPLFPDSLNFLPRLSKLQYLDLRYVAYGLLGGMRMPIPSFLGTMTSLTHLDLSYAGFMGKIPYQIGNLSNLVYLDLSNVVNGTIPSQIRNLSNLIYLDLQSYHDESLFAKNVDWLSSMSKLEYLDLSGNDLLGASMPIPSFLGTMTSLTHLDLSYAGFMGNIPHQIGNLSNLIYLGLSYVANGTIPSQIGNLSNLVYLELEGHYDEPLFADSLHFLSSLSKLQYLHLRYVYANSAYGLLGGLHMPIPSLLGTMTSLTHLDLSYVGFMGKIPHQIGNLSNLVYLYLSYGANGTIPSQIGNLSNLIYLDLKSYSDESLFAENVDWLSSMSKLEYIDLESANLTKSFDWLNTLQALPSLKHLSLSGCSLPVHYNQPSFLNFSSLLTLDLSFVSFSFVPKWIFGLTKLVSLQLSDNEIQGPIPDGNQNLTLLENLDLSHNSFSSSIPHWLYRLHHLMSLNLQNNKFHGTISDALGNLTSLLQLDFSNNSIGGALPKSFGKLSSLRYLFLFENQFCGNPFESLKSLSNLSDLDIGDNHFHGIVEEDHLANLTSLEVFYASRNNFSLKVHPNWLPHFQLTELGMSSWKLGPNFPSWIASQNKLVYLEMSNTGILDSIPTWIWDAFPQVYYLNLSRNHIHGELATTFKHPISIERVDLSSNDLHGKLPYLSDQVYRLDLSSNSFSGSMTHFLCNKQFKQFELNVLNLASNNLSGQIPDCWMNWPFLVDVNLQGNHFAWNLPPSMGSLSELQFVHMSNNSFSGIFPTIFMKTNKLISLDLGENNFSGTIPTWVGERLLSVKILRLRSNKFLGNIPNKICEMSHLQVLDLAENNLSGNIPSCFNNLSAMTQLNRSMDPRIYSQAPVNATHYFEFCIASVLLWLKGREDEYQNILGLVTSIDLSNNKLSGEIPKEITNIDGLYFLNLSHNQLIGHIPQGIGNMRSLQSIDFSWNQLSGEIPPTISNLSFLSVLNLSYNHLNGKIPTGTQLQTLDAFSFIGNNLCGPPLPINCITNGKNDSYAHNGKVSDRHGVNWFFVSMTIGFIVGFWVVVAPLFISRSWRYAYFRFLDDMWHRPQFLW